MSPDVIDAVFGGLQPRGEFFYRSELAGPWGFATEFGKTTFHYVEAGQCVLTVGDESYALSPGDLAVVPQQAALAFRDAPGRPLLPVGEFFARYPPSDDGVLRVDGPGPPAVLLCGGVTFDDVVAHPALDALPSVLVVREADAEGPNDEGRPWLASTLAFLAHESRSNRPGAATVMGHLASVVFLQAVRGTCGSGRGGWLGALADPYVGPALDAIQRAPEAPWTVEALGREAGLGRSAFAARFREAVGESPMRHVTRWRVYRAARLLQRDATLAEAAAHVGYESEAAFSRAFKRWTGRSPGEIRRGASVGG